MKRVLFLTIFFVVSGLVEAQSVISININGSINPASAAFINRAITKAANQKAECIIIHLNTPGGLLKSTRVIVADIFYF